MPDETLPAPTNPRAEPPSAAEGSTVVSGPAERTATHIPAGEVPPPEGASDRTGPYVPADGPADAPPGYEVLEEIGRGGMGVVYKARHLQLNRVVALKMILAGGHASARERVRFLQEAEAEARLHHPNIVQVYEVGQHGELPYFTQEYVPGGTLTRYARDPLPAREVAGLVEAIARGVAHAHTQGIIHRDLKPDNVLLTADRVPKVTDFGLAKKVGAGDGLTATGAIMGTPSYMAPEQARGDTKAIGPAADVYAVGAILYRLLTGRPPFAAATPLETARLVTETDPLSPSVLVPRVPRDVETICLKCLRKAPAQRYATAGELADDLRRFLNGEPIRARPVGRLERAWKWVKRNRWPVAMAAAVIVALAVGFGVATWQAVVANKARTVAETNETKAVRAVEEERKALGLAQTRLGQVKKGNAILVSMYQKVNPDAEEKQGRSLRVVLGEQLDQATAELDGEAVGDPLAVAELQHALGEAQLGLGFAEKAARLFTASLRTTETLLGPDHPDALTARSNLAAAYLEMGRATEAARIATEVIAAREAVLGTHHPDTLSTRYVLAGAYRALGRTAEAARLLAEVVADRTRVLGEDHRDTLGSRSALGLLYLDMGQHTAAVLALEGVLKAAEAKDGPHHPATLSTRNNLALAYDALGRFADAARMHEVTLQSWEANVGPDHPDTLAARHNLVAAYLRLGQTAEAVKMAELNRKLCEAKLGPDHPNTLNARHILGAGYGELGRTDEAARLHEQTLRAREVKLGADHPQTLVSRNSLALAYVAVDRHAEAVPLLERVLQAREAHHGPDHPDTLTTRNNLAATYAELGRSDDAARLLVLNLRLGEAKHGLDHPSTLSTRNNLAAVTSTLGRRTDAARILEEVYKDREALHGPDHPATLTARNNLAVVYGQLGRIAKEIRLQKENLKLAVDRYGPDHPHSVSAMHQLASAYLVNRNADAAVSLLRDYIAAQRRKLAPDDPEFALKLLQIGWQLLTSGQPAAAEGFLREYLAVRLKNEPNTWNSFTAQATLGWALVDQKKYAEAEPLLKAGFDGMRTWEKVFRPVDRALMATAATGLAQICDDAGRSDEAKKWRDAAARYAEVAPPPRRAK
jgi:tetratricopeptide (TPR) repeat protein/tRNA A-37 threonylcarbamoyl transferase component Bud32